jgi:hypothetical protein
MRTSENLPPFHPGGGCPKCGCGAVKVTWHLIGLEEGFPCEHRVDLDEHLCRTCPACKYGWLEATKDASASEPRRLRPAR